MVPQAFCTAKPFRRSACTAAQEPRPITCRSVRKPSFLACRQDRHPVASQIATVTRIACHELNRRWGRWREPRPQAAPRRCVVMKNCHPLAPAPPPWCSPVTTPRTPHSAAHCADGSHLCCRSMAIARPFPLFFSPKDQSQAERQRGMPPTIARSLTVADQRQAGQCRAKGNKTKGRHHIRGGLVKGPSAPGPAAKRGSI